MITSIPTIAPASGKTTAQINEAFNVLNTNLSQVEQSATLLSSDVDKHLRWLAANQTAITSWLAANQTASFSGSNTLFLDAYDLQGLSVGSDITLSDTVTLPEYGMMTLAPLSGSLGSLQNLLTVTDTNGKVWVPKQTQLTWSLGGESPWLPTNTDLGTLAVQQNLTAAMDGNTTTVCEIPTTDGTEVHLRVVLPLSLMSNAQVNLIALHVSPVFGATLTSATYQVLGIDIDFFTTAAGYWTVSQSSYESRPFLFIIPASRVTQLDFVFTVPQAGDSLFIQHIGAYATDFPTMGSIEIDVGDLLPAGATISSLHDNNIDCNPGETSRPPATYTDTTVSVTLGTDSVKNVPEVLHQLVIGYTFDAMGQAWEYDVDGNVQPKATIVQDDLLWTVGTDGSLSPKVGT